MIGDERTPIGEDGLRAGPHGAGPRVLLLGDEELFAAGRPDEQTLHAQLARRLEEAGVAAEVQNGAVPGYSVLQTRAWLDARGWALEPDLLVFAPGLSDCAPATTTDAALMACLRAPSRRLSWSWGLPRSATALLAQGRGGDAATPIGCPSHAPGPRVPAQDFAVALDALLLEAGQRQVGVLMLLSDAPRAEGCPHSEVTRRLGTRRAVPTIDLAEVNRAAGSWGRGARSADGQPSIDATAAAAQATADLLVGGRWPAQRMAPELAAPPYAAADALRMIPPGK
ncbi:MAG: hypothetical protein H6740_22940 [Alphaproteobacteria bacterium]|nr:hypothetical protein [Alphaproteobacteria bacterium]